MNCRTANVAVGEFSILTRGRNSAELFAASLPVTNGLRWAVFDRGMEGDKNENILVDFAICDGPEELLGVYHAVYITFGK